MLNFIYQKKCEVEKLVHKKIFDKITADFHNGKLHHALILHGMNGSGKGFLVSNLIDTIFDGNKEKYQTNIKIISKIDKKTEIVVDQIKSLDGFFNLAASNEMPRIVVIDKADDMNINAKNALLKKLEEPPENCFFFLLIDDILAMEDTIKSRAIKIYVPNLSFEDWQFITKSDNREIYEISGHSTRTIDAELLRNYEEILKSVTTKNVENIYSISKKITNENWENFVFIYEIMIGRIVKRHANHNLQPIFDGEIELLNCFKNASIMSIYTSKDKALVFYNANELSLSKTSFYAENLINIANVI